MKTFKDIMPGDTIYIVNTGTDANICRIEEYKVVETRQSENWKHIIVNFGTNNNVTYVILSNNFNGTTNGSIHTTEAAALQQLAKVAPVQIGYAKETAQKLYAKWVYWKNLIESAENYLEKSKQKLKDYNKEINYLL